MGGFTFDLGHLAPFQLETLARNLQTTLNLWYDGPSHRGAQSNFFRVDPETNYDPAPAPVAMRGVVASVRDGGRVRVAGLDPAAAAIVSTMVAQTVTRLEGGGPSGQELAEALGGLRARFDRYFRVPDDEQARLVLAGRPGAERERQQAVERGRRDAAARRDRQRAEERRGVLETVPSDDGGWR